MFYAIDTEFNNRGPKFPIELISFAMVAEDGRELYLVAENKDFSPQQCNDFVKQNVLPKIENEKRTPLSEFKTKIEAFLKEDPHPYFVGYFCYTDFSLFHQLFKGELPEKYAKFCNEIMQLYTFLGCPRLPKKPQANERHSALVDARWTKEAWERLQRIVTRAELRSKKPEDF